MATLIALGASACGTDVQGRAERTGPDISALEVGNYQTEPRQVGNAKSDKQARARESQRLADFVALPFEADPAYIEDVWRLRSHIVLNRKALAHLVINDTFDDVAEDLVGGWVNAWSTGGPPEALRRTLNIAVLMFPDPETALRVGPALERDDFTYNRENQPVQITGYPNTFAHWRPDFSSIGSWTVHDRYVVFIKVDDNTSAPDLPALTAQVERMLEVQLPLLDKFEPTPVDSLAHIPLDPEGIVGRTLPSDPEKPFRIEPDGFYTGRGALTLMADPGPDILLDWQESEMDLASFGDAVVFRNKSGEGAQRLWQGWQASMNSSANQELVDTPTGLDSNIECYAQATRSPDSDQVVGYNCGYRVDRYFVQVSGKNLRDLHQRASAQYALLTSE
ncbi:hypothetical protein ACL02S_14490 [Nocardia sp. 004]|uniref:DUF7373 family lipoprotein n=1 Tax=Nocardia sp. 004 TaxID=3385978 RepID=UPI0039A1B8EE